MAFILESGAFAPGQPIPVHYTGDGENFSPPLVWTGAPADTQSFVLIVEDPDAPSGLFSHWGIYNLKATTLEEDDGNPDAPYQARNDFGHVEYDGPLPPKSHGVHHYHFRLAALKVAELTFEVTPGVQELWQAAQPHITAEAELIGTYER